MKFKILLTSISVIVSNFIDNVSSMEYHCSSKEDWSIKNLEEKIANMFKSITQESDKNTIVQDFIFNDDNCNIISKYLEKFINMYGTVDVSNNRKLETHSRHVMTFIFYDYAKEYFKHFVNGEIKKVKDFNNKSDYRKEKIKRNIISSVVNNVKNKYRY